MINKKKLFLLTYVIIAMVASFNIFTYIVDNLEHQFITIMDKNSLIFEDKVIKINDVLELQGKKANLLISLKDLPERFEHSEYNDMLKYFAYDEKNDVFHLDNIVNSSYDTTEISNITGNGNLDFMKDKDSLKALEVYLSFFMNKEYKWLNDRLEASDWIYYTSLNKMTSIRTRSAKYTTSDEFHFMDEMLDMSFVTDGYKENMKNRENVYWSSPYLDLAGKGIMVTASYPVDYNDEYVGSISIDFISGSLSKILAEDYATFIVDAEGVIFATNIEDIDISSELKTVDDLSLGLMFSDIKDIEYDKLMKINGVRVMAHQLKGSPYILYQVYPKEIYLMDAAIDFFPLLLIFAFFGVTSFMLHRVRESEAKLKETLSELEHKQEELDYLSKYDILTNIYNRRGLYSEIKKLEIDGKLIGSSVILFDIDHFKRVNDTFGHDVGDDVLTEISVVIKGLISDNEIFARYGGEEFIIISKGTGLQETCGIAEIIRNGVEKHNFKTINNLTVSLGVSTFRSKDTSDTWITNADAALYKAKSNGRNKVYYFESQEFIGYSTDN